MSLFFRKHPQAEDRSINVPPVLAEYLTSNYSTVNPAVGDSSLQSVAIRSTADLIASLVSELPADVYRNGRRVSGGGGPVEDPGGDGSGREDWLYRLMMSFLLRGNAYGTEVEWDVRTGAAKAVDLFHPDDVSAIDGTRDVPVQWFHKGQRVEGHNLRTFKHWRMNPVAGRILGLSPIAQHATTIGISLRSAKFADQFFADGAHPTAMLVNKAKLSTVDAVGAKARLLSVMQGSREPLVLGEGWDFKEIQISPEESQFLQTQAFSEAQCARMFGPGFAEVMGYESGGSMTYANVVDRRQDLLVLSMNKWIRRADRILTSLLPPSTLSVRLDRDALLEATTLQRYQAHELALRNKWRTVNEVRAIEDLEPVAWGDSPNNNTAQEVAGGQS